VIEIDHPADEVRRKTRMRAEIEQVDAVVGAHRVVAEMRSPWMTP
jgi:hypothetical protein